MDYQNRLVNEDSPYLKQHAHNPVDWYPWGTEAFVLARQQNKPVFLSIGYATCHWCHVMERESFENEDIARILNDHFVSIKIDREQYPEIDEIYMMGVQLLTGQGGWPMSNFLTPEGEPFFAGTYFPPQSFLDLLQRITSLWKTNNEVVRNQATEVTQAIRKHVQATAEPVDFPENIASVAAEELLARLDRVHGGFGSSPKFPSEPQLSLLLEMSQRSGGKHLLEALELSLQSMARGGIHDQVGGGFHRYTVDQQWLTPHFEKMLYNQAQLLELYLGAFSLTAKEEYARVAEEIIAYVIRDMQSPDGAFYSATDADSEGEEGRFFVWSLNDITEVLGEDLGGLAAQIYGVTEGGNFEGKNILCMSLSLESLADNLSLPLSTLLSRRTAIREKLYKAREERVRPLRDEKIILSWNAMFISALLKGYQVLGRKDLFDLAEKAGELIWSRMYIDSDDGMRLRRIQMNGRVSTFAGLEDYAFFIEACLNLHLLQEGFHESKDLWLTRATLLTNEMVLLFSDEERGGFYTTAMDHEVSLITRSKSPADGAMPSANAKALCALELFVRMSRNDSDREKARMLIGRAVAYYSGLIKASPSSFPYLLRVINTYRVGPVAAVQVAAGGKLRVWGQAESGSEGLHKIILKVELCHHWMIYDSASDDVDGRATSIVLEEGSGVIQHIEWPRGEVHRLAGVSGDIVETPVYMGSFSIACLIRTPHSLLNVRFAFQACTDSYCLQPEILNLLVPLKEAQA